VGRGFTLSFPLPHKLNTMRKFKIGDEVIINWQGEYSNIKGLIIGDKTYNDKANYTYMTKILTPEHLRGEIKIFWEGFLVLYGKKEQKIYGISKFIDKLNKKEKIK
jgi:hypothetical protein